MTVRLMVRLHIDYCGIHVNGEQPVQCPYPPLCVQKRAIAPPTKDLVSIHLTFNISFVLHGLT